MSPTNTFDFADNAVLQIWMNDLLAQVLTLLGWILLALAAVGLVAYLFGIFRLCRAASRKQHGQSPPVPNVAHINQPRPRFHLVANNRRKQI